MFFLEKELNKDLICEKGCVLSVFQLRIMILHICAKHLILKTDLRAFKNDTRNCDISLPVPLSLTR